MWQVDLMDLRAEAVDFAYGDRKVLSGVTANFEPGRMSGIIGPNGSGKSTLIKLLSGEFTPAAGRVLIGGAPIGTIKLGALTRMISVVPQSLSLDFDFTVMDVVLMGRMPYIGRLGSESEEDIAIAERAMRDMGVYHLADRPVPAISGGEWQRVIVARALCQQTGIMLLDEPVSNLDIAHQLDVLRKVRALVSEKSRTAVCVLHDLNLASHFCDDLVLMREGKVFACGSPAQVLTESAVREVYGVRVSISTDEQGRPTVTPDYDEEIAL